MNPLVTICIPFSRKVHPAWAMSFAQIAPPMNAMLDTRMIVGAPRDIAREEMAESATKAGSKFILCLDDDVTVPSHILRSLLYAFETGPKDLMVVGGIYCTKTIPAIPLVFKTAGEGPFYRWKFGEMFPVEIIATGMMMIKTEVFQHLSKPWFKDVDGIEEGQKYGLIPDDFEGENYAINDDGFFCKKVNSAGFKVAAHGGVLGIHWDNIGTRYVIPDNAYPMKCAMQKYFPELPKSEEEYIKRVMGIYESVYGHADLLPIGVSADKKVFKLYASWATEEVPVR